ncbi:MAG TPA: SOS response-associated peptidase [Acidothermaceae bacterium]|jgi:putative SOS response-associated peptidase YedK|nr:SOS response-associated peptidase [Acidothermaceae bacterium]
MCGRYATARNPDDLVEEFGIDRVAVEEQLAPNYNVAPTDPVYAVVERIDKENKQQPPQRQLRVVRWGLVPSWAKDPKIGSRLINARAETLAEKPAFRKAFASRRCLLPADGYYEWYADDGATDTPKKGAKKQPFFIHNRGGGIVPMAGLYEFWRDADAPEGSDPWLWSCTVITTEAADDLGRIHDRMPMLVEPQNWDKWLDPRIDDQDVLQQLLVPAAPGRLEAYAVSTEVNDVRNNGPELIAPVEGIAVPGS